MTNLRIDGRSQVPSAIATYGVYVTPIAEDLKEVPYDGRSLPIFILNNGGNPQQWREILVLNEKGSVYDLEVGESFLIPQSRNNFSIHPNA